jgi:uncharacterized protein (DUF4415 family)
LDQPWIDPDDAPELTDEFFKRGQWMIGDKPVDALTGKLMMRKELARGRPKSESPKTSVTVRYDNEVVDAFKGTGKGWQTRMNDALREWLATHPLGQK